MKKEEPGRQLKVRITPKEREFFLATACNVDVPHNMLMRHLVRYVLRDGIDWANLLKESRELSNNAAQEQNDTKKVVMSTQLTPELYAAFIRLAEEWGSTASVIMRPKSATFLWRSGKLASVNRKESSL
jgi:uncharacterized protein YueI